MKTRNAFAFRDFDSSRILQRNFFKNFYFKPDKSDAEILDSLNNATTDSVDSLEKNLYAIKAIHDRLREFRHLIDRHNENRLNKYNRKKSELEGIKITELQRPAPVMEYFNASISVSDLMNQFEKLYSDIEKRIQVRYRKDFGTRLKRARQALGLTQQQVGDLIRVSSQGISLYELGKRDASIPTIIKFAKVLNMNGNQILGLE